MPLPSVALPACNHGVPLHDNNTTNGRGVRRARHATSLAPIFNSH
jgi:hypothetical protein